MEAAEKFLEVVRNILKVQKISGDFFYEPFEAFHIFDPSKKMVYELGISPEGINTTRREHDEGMYPWEHSFVVFGIHFYWISKSADPFYYAPTEENQ